MSNRFVQSATFEALHSRKRSSDNPSLMSMQDVARPRNGLGQIGDRAVALLHPPDVYDTRFEIDILPQQPKLFAGPRAGEEREGDVEPPFPVFVGVLDEFGHLLGGQQYFLGLGFPAP